MYLITTVAQRLVHEFALLYIEVQFEIAVLSMWCTRHAHWH